MGKRGFQPHPALSSAATVTALLRKHRWSVAAAAEDIGRTKNAVRVALKRYGVSIPEKQAKRIGAAQRRNAANARWGKR